MSKYAVPFTLYIPPNGKTKSIHWATDDEELYNMAHELIDDGCIFDIEALQTGVLSMTCMKDDECLSIQLSPPGSDDKEVTATLIREAYAKAKA